MQQSVDFANIIQSCESNKSCFKPDTNSPLFSNVSTNTDSSLSPSEFSSKTDGVLETSIPTPSEGGSIRYGVCIVAAKTFSHVGEIEHFPSDESSLLIGGNTKGWYSLEKMGC